MNPVSQKLFYSWQDDQPNPVCRNFIEDCLEKALKKVVVAASVEAAERPKMELDKDTQNVPGSPAIAETIFSKIDAAFAYVADLTFVGTRVNGRPTPNPNVLIEYGWALRSLTDTKLIGVMNTAYGLPTWLNLPFNLRHRRWPIQYHLPENTTEEDKKKARDELVKDLTKAITAIASGIVPTTSKTSAATFPAASAKDGNARFRPKGEPLGIIDSTFGKSKHEVTLLEGAAIWLRVMPELEQSRVTRNTELLRIISTQGKLILPMGTGSSGDYVRGPDGVGTITVNVADRSVTPSVVYLFQSGEIWAVNVQYLPDGQYLVLNERELSVLFAQAIKHLRDERGITGRFRWIAGIEDTKNRTFIPQSLPGKWRYASERTCTKPEIIESRIYDPRDSVHLALVPFFEEVYDSCGLLRPTELNDGLK